jgi:hypothetical protein
MKTFAQRHAIMLAALLQVLPIVRNFFTSPAATSTFAFILRWGIGVTAAVSGVDAVSGATNNFTSAGTFTGTVGVPFTNSLTLKSTGSDGGAATIITSNLVNTIITVSGQSTNFDMPPGLLLQFQDNSSVNPNNPVYDAVFGTPTTPGTNTFTVTLEYHSLTVSTNITIQILAAGSVTLPKITNQPVSVTNLAGSSSTFSVTAGPSPLTYQWFFNTNTILPGATSSTLTLNGIQLNTSGIYTVVASNSSGTVTSSPARLTVWQPPVITNQPTGLTKLAGSPGSFSVVAGGFPAINYQWTFNTAPIASATSATLNLSNVRLSQAGNYAVIITNTAGSVTSSPALLAVTIPPSPRLTSPTTITTGSGGFQFTFNPVAGLTNTVQVTTSLTGSSWATLTNIASPATTNAVTVSDVLTPTNRYYRVQIIP